MNACLCCTRNIPVSGKKKCPLCGHSLMGHGWSGIGYHWKVRHEAGMPFITFWAGLCELHRANRPPGVASADTSAISPIIKSMPEPGGDPRKKALARRSGDIENVLIHSLIATVADGLWQRDHCLDLQVFKPELKDSAFDLVLGFNEFRRNIQIRQLPTLKNAVDFTLRQDFARMVGGCAVVLVYCPSTLEIQHYLFFEGGAGMPMPSLKDCPVAIRHKLRVEDGDNNFFETCRNVPHKLFVGPLNGAELVDRLYPLTATRIPSPRLPAKRYLEERRERDGGAQKPPQVGSQFEYEHAAITGNGFKDRNGNVGLWPAA